MRIYKYPLDLVDSQTVQIQRPIKILTAQVQNGIICAWALIDEEPKFTREVQFLIVGTGNPNDFDLTEFEYLSTVQLNSFVWHIFVNKL